MKITPELLQQQWDSIVYRDGGFLQIDTQHPLDWFLGYQMISRRTLLLLSTSEIGPIASSKSMDVIRRKREDGKWVLTFELLIEEHESVFSIFCYDIIENSRHADTADIALALVVKRYQQWIKLLESQKGGIMGESVRKGLIGELLFLEQLLRGAIAYLPIIQGWSGTEGADQDFIYADVWYEIKTLGLSATTVQISSLEQLDRIDNGYLVVMRVDKTSPEREGAFSINDLVLRIKNTLLIDSVAFAEFQMKLVNYGYIDLKEYNEQKYFYSCQQVYAVNASFPRLIASTVPTQVTKIRYELSLPSLISWLKG